MTYTEAFLTDQIERTSVGMAEAAEAIAASLDKAATHVRRSLLPACKKGTTADVLTEIGNLHSTLGNMMAGMAVSPLMSRIEVRVMLEQQLALLNATDQAEAAAGT